ncbi:50S ribosomal protein L11 methyltransferase [Kitasatospora sp. YST-16]|uniref:50S ribosomal protein L11 methyltransferase n=1 Tax=Kitasatospora sp. YST-16 TaxID=2998080 RepID=UPI0022852AE3|nr:50S ribosomal protein L11 methyltransferase [Kitasatospora sp. YST-16]WAL73140.1 50S ribosomal protein L11 methyltransferase [Kitasatospora sp. YST-16]WNW39194.1 50S ribosomal protein L11 methyltransferase [Streptomyces sp. Li-HN-5-13]
MDWQKYAAELAAQTTDPDSRWRRPVAEVPRHLLVPRWWEPAEGGSWRLQVGEKDPDLWARRAYGHESVVTSVGGLHADHATPDDIPTGRTTSSATLTALVVKMLRHARINAEHHVLDIGTGAGGLTAIASLRVGDNHVTSVDVDEYLTAAAKVRLNGMGLHPEFLTLDATGPIPGSYDRIVATVSARPVPASWLQALRRGGRLVTTIADTALILTAWKDADGGASGVIERDWAGFMTTRHGPTYPPTLEHLFRAAREGEGEEVKGYRYPVADIRNNWEVWSMLTINTPGVEIDFEERPGKRTAYLVHPDGSWARAEAERFEPPTVHQSGPRRLWEDLERIRNWREVEGGLPLYGSKARIDPDGTIRLSRGRWAATIGT